MNMLKIHENEVPYGILAQFGLSQDMIEDLPEAARKDIFDGRNSPVLPIRVTNNAGEEIHARTRFSLLRKEDGSVDVVFLPVRNTANLDMYSADEKASLLKGHAIVKAMVNEDGVQMDAFHQIDPDTNQILFVPTPVIYRNLQLIGETMKLNPGELACLQKGLPITIIDEDDEVMTVGVDLNEIHGLRYVLGDEARWRKEERKPFGKYNFGMNGCWIVDDNGNMEYIHEDDYTPDMWEELRKKNISRGRTQ